MRKDEVKDDGGVCSVAQRNVEHGAGQRARSVSVIKFIHPKVQSFCL